ncbi:hypothetical protein [Rhabdochromatium marinum]|uniref:hypothetical protein n=1 Tax=Rhabdochromatium marinum TaxID=48729 RepID=UPI001903E16F|nr:hypothetical protein [Rhabdochromatium marinum]MBK1649773.1 hypothetical protein [Rhabdochromatium marinum]
MRERMRLLPGFALIILLAHGGWVLAQSLERLADAAPASTADSPAFSLHSSHGKLSLHAENASLRAVLEAVAAHSNIGVWVSPHLPRVSLNLSFADLDFAQGLAQMLDSTSYVLTRAAGAETSGISHIHVLALADALTEQPPAKSASDPGDESDRADEQPGLPPGFAASIRATRAALSASQQAAIFAQGAFIDQRLQQLLDPSGVLH